MTATELHAGLMRTLQGIDALAPSLRADWDADRVLRLAVMKLWIDAGNYAEVYRREAGLAVRAQPWSALVGYRGMLAHQLPEDLSDERLRLNVCEINDVRARVSAAP